MTDRAYPSTDSEAKSRHTATTIEAAGGSDGWVVPSGDDPGGLAADEADITEASLDAFDISHSASSLDVDIQPGAAFLGGAWIARDLTTEVTLGASTTSTILLSWEPGTSHTIDIDEESGIETSDPNMELWEVTTDASGVTDTTDLRNLDAYRVSNERVEALSSLEAGDILTGYPLGSDDLGDDLALVVVSIEDLSIDGQEPVVSDDAYEIQKDGTDGAGVINFKSS